MTSELTQHEQTASHGMRSLTPQEEAFVRLVATEGLPVKKAAEHPDVQIPLRTAYAWNIHPRIVAAKEALLRGNRVRNQATATAKLDKAWRTIDNALTNPNISPTQFKAAAFIIAQANGVQEAENTGVSFTLQVNTQLNTNALAEQQARHSQPAQRSHPQDADGFIEGGFTVVSSDDGQL